MYVKQILIGLLVTISLPGFTQLKRYPIEQSFNKKEVTGLKTKSLEPMSLPFWDDFFSEANSDTLWENKATVWINNTMAIKPPTIGVATFDGLNENGQPHRPNPDQILDVGFTDSLESRKIKMTEVPLFQRNSVFLSFFYQWGGHGEAPDANDNLRVEFLTSTGVWQQVLFIEIEDNQQPDEFYAVTLRINQNEYYHDDFQFRFRSFGRQSGNFDAWHIDYVYLNRGRTENDLANGFPDRAPNQLLGPLFNSYYAVPKEHFFTDAANNTTQPVFGISNLSSIPQPTNYNLDATVISFKDGVETEQFFQAATSFPVLPSMQAFERRVIPIGVKPDLTPFAAEDSLFINIRTTYITGDSVNTGFEPINFYANDTIRQSYTLTNYYAYDDGSAEYAVGLTQRGNLAAYRFVMQTPEADTVIGVQVHYPISTGVSAANATFYIWSNEDDSPGNILLQELAPVQRTTNSQFIQHIFTQSAIVKDTFYLGWEQPNDRVVIGLDAGNNSGDHIFVNTTGSWIQNTTIEGSLMIRPIFGKGNVITSIIPEKKKEVSLYPNPNRGEFFLEGEVDRLSVYNATGQPVTFEAVSFDNRQRIQLAQPKPGLYFVRYFNGQVYSVEKFIIRE
ncbi:MAG: T9SS type A sorting domain-containing protein [Cyclobacteriaceae bacterium]|nr:T9SS type A sorting domain-containing protein [Cyclobacteriaceae bacterium]